MFSFSSPTRLRSKDPRNVVLIFDALIICQRMIKRFTLHESHTVIAASYGQLWLFPCTSFCSFTATVFLSQRTRPRFMQSTDSSSFIYSGSLNASFFHPQHTVSSWEQSRISHSNPMYYLIPVVTGIRFSMQDFYGLISSKWKCTWAISVYLKNYCASTKNSVDLNSKSFCSQQHKKLVYDTCEPIIQ